MSNVYAPDPTVASTTYFKPLFSFSPGLSGSFDIGAIVPIVMLVIFLIWIVYTLVAAYHWFRYGHRSWIAIPALGVHIFVSGALLLYALTGLH
jgi:hypothetical protein